MDELLYYVLIFAFWWFIGLPLVRYLAYKSAVKFFGKTPNHPIILEKCPPHRWAYSEAGCMYCSRCKKVPGQS